MRYYVSTRSSWKW